VSVCVDDKAEMSLLSLCVLIVIQMTSSQSTYDVTQQGSDVNSCGCTEQELSELVTIQSAVLQLQRDVADMKASIARKNAGGMCVLFL